MHYKWSAKIMFICFCGSMVSSTDFNSLFWKCCFIRNTQCWKYEILFKMHYKWLAKIKFISLCGLMVSSTNFNSLFWKCCFIRNTQMLKIWNFIKNSLQMVGKENKLASNLYKLNPWKQTLIFLTEKNPVKVIVIYLS